MRYDYDIIVVGGGHAGMEASFASAHLGLNTLLITLNFKKISNMPCNPSIGGSAKGIVVREIDALGGMMGIMADEGALQIKLLNTGKGPGVQCLRAQEDKINYPLIVQKHALNTKNLTIKEGMVTDLLHDDKRVFGVKVGTEEIYSKAVILTTGTYMESQILVGHTSKEAGPDGEKASKGLSPKLKEMGIKILRLKTGTPQRIARDSINFDVLEPQYGMEGDLNFSFDHDKKWTIDEQALCHLTYTNEKTHKIIREHLHDSAMYGGMVTGVGPRYCPSIEDKIVRFADKERHQLFIEPESLYTDSMYLQGFSTSMPEEVQEKMVHSLKGLENAKILKYAYAIEYDAIYPTQFDPTLMVKKYENLYCAGQICGTSGYEEAAALGLMAGINASLKILNKEPLILKRDEAYIGVMIDDLINKGTKEPYRLLSSRAEYRLLLRHDNADLRLRKYGYDIGLVSQEKYDNFLLKKENILKNKEILEKAILSSKGEVADRIRASIDADFKGGISLASLLKRPGVYYKDIESFTDKLLPLNDNGKQQLEVMIKYEGYIQKEIKEAERMRKLEEMKIPRGIDYLHMDGLALEAREKFNEIDPLTIGQASRISGVNPSDIATLLLYIRKDKND